MNDLVSLDWNDAGSSGPKGPPHAAQGNYYPTLRPTPPISGRSTPQLPATASVNKSLSSLPGGSRAPTPANDSFASLVSFGNKQQPTSSITLQERQRLLQEQEKERAAVHSQQLDSFFGAPLNGSLANGNGRSAPDRAPAPPTYTATEDYGGQKLSQLVNKPFAGIPTASQTAKSRPVEEDDEDILAAFSASAPVDKSSHMTEDLRPNSSAKVTNGVMKSLRPDDVRSENGTHANEFDDDPFGLGFASTKDAPSGSARTGSTENRGQDDDVLGLLGRPVTEFAKKSEPAEEARELSATSSSKDHALAELLDMGFASEKAVAALATTESGSDVQAAVGWLLSQAHEESRGQSRPSHTRNGDRDQTLSARPSHGHSVRRTSPNSGGSRPAWMSEQDRASSGQRRKEGEKDPAQYASEIGSNLFKTAGSLWKTGTKKLNSVVSELNTEADARQPKWMKEDQPEAEVRKTRTRQRAHDIPSSNNRSPQKSTQPDVTDEALMLESGNARPQRKTATQAPPASPGQTTRPLDDDIRTARLPSRHAERLPPSQKALNQTQLRDPRTRINRQAVEEEAAEAYISPARRKRNPLKPPEQTPEPFTEPNLLFEDSNQQTKPTAVTAQASKSLPQRTRVIPSKPVAPTRTIPSVSPPALNTSSASRKAGTAAYKRGDYADATTHYSAALRALPQAHPLTLPLLANRALTHQKTGDPKASIADADACLTLIGPSRGVGEVVSGGEEGDKAMDVYWGKAMTRKAEAFEQLERWSDAAVAWRSCVEAGVGGALSIAGRNRCEGAARPKPKSAPSANKTIPSRPRPIPSAMNDLGSEKIQSAAAVGRLRAANIAADKLDDEKFALADQVDARVSGWKTGKEANLRALLASLENVLWEGAGWKKTGMGELIQPNKVKVVYMRGIGKVHPDKVREDCMAPFPSADSRGMV